MLYLYRQAHEQESIKKQAPTWETLRGSPTAVHGLGALCQPHRGQPTAGHTQTLSPQSTGACASITPGTQLRTQATGHSRLWISVPRCLGMWVQKAARGALLSPGGAPQESCVGSCCSSAGALVILSLDAPTGCRPQPRVLPLLLSGSQLHNHGWCGESVPALC